MKITFLYYKKFSSFIENDYNILSRHFLVDKVCINSPKDILKMAKSIAHSDLVYVWFADKIAASAVFLSRSFGKKSIVVAGGYDVTSFPEIGYGQFCPTKHMDKLYAKFALENADIVLAVSKFTRCEMYKNWISPKVVKTIYNGVDIEKFVPIYDDNMEIKKDKFFVLTVVSPQENVDQLIKLKGLDTFCRVASRLPKLAFWVVGLRETQVPDYLKHDNMFFAGPLSQDKLIKLYQDAFIYCQLSLTESFGMSLVEAMACGCIPVVTNKGAMPEIIQSSSYTVPYGDVDKAADLINKILATKMWKDPAIYFRERATLYSIKNREEKLINTIKGLMGR